MKTYEELKGIDFYSTWRIIDKINKGWSDDDKYYIKDDCGKEFLLRTSDIATLENKKREYEILSKISECNINMSMPISFGTYANNAKVYSLLTWVAGNDAESVLPELNETEQYKLGIEAGQILKAIHTIPAPKNQQKWSDRFNKKIDRNINNYINCDIRVSHADKLIKYINDNRYLLENRKQTMQHGDFHVGNLVINESLHIGVIDFNRYDYGDPWEEYKRTAFSLSISEPFVIGQIHGYFSNDVPEVFFRLLALYQASNSLSSVPWAIKFGRKEVDVMLRNITKMLEYYDYFNTYMPRWYKQI
ncbi:aminoglycoside phosphotransferase family protein [Clostridium oryzae]|uniref:Phosphotransferase enzyme family protein n=1 Tax=Clostridium oryzae TaxID=1450648 RepID=A0A1V4IS61_9CLOT|nr:phosphotransferase [Clostridium oryzae]OPJ62871.1 phosphotransferase enzyme family protein [Clostridium oryzae]